MANSDDCDVGDAVKSSEEVLQLGWGNLVPFDLYHKLVSELLIYAYLIALLSTFNRIIGLH